MFRFASVTFATLAFAVLSTLSLPSECVHAQAGRWNASLESPGGPIRFGLKLAKSDTEGKWSAWLINGTEEIEVPEVIVAGDRKVVLNIDHYDSQLVLEPVGETDISRLKMKGTWKKRRSSNIWVEMKVSVFSPVDNTSASEKRISEFAGRWSVKFSDSEDPAVGIFETNPDTGEANGTFLTTTGDYRFLSGNVLGNTMKLSCFDGAHAFLFRATLNEDGILDGDFWSSNYWHETWTATRDANAKLPDSFQQTTATEDSINSLSFPDLDGEETKLDDPRFIAPVRIVHIFGSWCPNCHDAGEYLAELKSRYGDDLSVVGIAFELTGDFNRDVGQVHKYLKRHKLDHPVLIGGGSSSKDKASKAISIIDKVRSYPTTVFADKSGKIVAVHQGFSGPATGEAYQELKQKFEKTIEAIFKKSK